ncbi:hypothetical protein [Paenibacillus herberti]|uniref:Uncharacterized protein n=1 Tax=Paenibacillus herberti TaxID=1619309 RepID=A0A229NXI8_9BACL|nr:hypothetical protein [Paenibacillus herberti]OXM14633.1 hypothetical protein CGZ75_17100 [Paenibacillus herberti]
MGNSFSNSAVILVLFILLVIVVSVFSSNLYLNPSDDDLGSLSRTQGYDIYNNTGIYTLVFDDKDGPISAPSDIFIPPGSRHHYEMLCNAGNKAEVEYEVWQSPAGEEIGSFEANLEVRSGCSYAKFSGLDSSSNIRLTTSGTNLYVYVT